MHIDHRHKTARLFSSIVADLETSRMWVAAVAVIAIVAALEAPAERLLALTAAQTASNQHSVRRLQNVDECT